MKTIEDKIKYLEKLTSLYVKFFKHYKNSKVEVVEDKVFLEYYNRKSKNAYHFKRKEFSINDLDKVILSLKGKINREFIKRSENKYLNI